MPERTDVTAKDIKDVLPLLPLKGTVILPYQVAPLGVGRQKSLKALEASLAGDRLLVLVAQKQDDIEDPTAEDLRKVGTVCRVVQVGRQPDGVLQVIIEGVMRAEVVSVEQVSPHFEARISTRPDPAEKDLELEAHTARLLDGRAHLGDQGFDVGRRHL